MIYYITRYTGNKKDAGTKAPKDIEMICEKNGWKSIEFVNPDIDSKSFAKVIKKIIVNNNNWKKLTKKVTKGDFVIYQHPMYFGTKFANKYIPLLQKKGVKFVALIHDLESLRNLTSTTKESKDSYVFGDMVLLEKFDYLIAHNLEMKEYLVNNGFNQEKIVCLEIFDYLCQTEFKNPQKTNTVDIAGNLDPNKCGYIYEIANNNPDVKMELFGGNYKEDISNTNLKYRGSFSSEKITGVLDGAFGIVWDGPTSKSCIGNTGNYLKYNNPHKTSMYLAAGIPVITWKEAAISKFVLENNVGIVVESLDDLISVINNVSVDEYEIMTQNARRIGKKLREGWYFQKAIESIFSLDLGEKKVEA